MKRKKRQRKGLEDDLDSGKIGERHLKYLESRIARESKRNGELMMLFLDSQKGRSIYYESGER